jgi:hypothetical protein
MADKLLISISARQVTAARWRGGRLGGTESFALGEDGLASFRQYLERMRNLPVQMLVDAVEEDYRVDSLPHSFGSERTEMVTRKLKQYYRNTPYCSAQLQGRDTGKRRDDQYLFCALTNPELIAPWLQALAERELPMAGIYLLPTLTPRLYSQLKLTQEKLLVVSIDPSGVRLTFLRDKKLRISRLAQIEAGGAPALKSYAEEIANTRLYLHALRILTLDEPLSVLIVDSNDSMIELTSTVARDNPNLDCRRLGRAEIIALLGISGATLDASGDALYLHLLGLHAPDNNLAPSHLTAGYRQHQTRHGINALTAVVAFAAATWCASTWYQIFTLQSEMDDARRQTALLQSQYLEATRQFPAAPTTADNMKRAVEISQKIGATLRSPEVMLNVVSQALEANPAIVLNSFGWKYDRTEIDTERSRSSKAASPATPSTTGTSANARRQSGLVEGEVRPFRGDYRAAIETIDRFAGTLSKRPEVAEVKVVKMPLNISPDLALTGNTTESREQAGKAEFKLVLVLKQTP